MGRRYEVMLTCRLTAAPGRLRQKEVLLGAIYGVSAAIDRVVAAVYAVERAVDCFGPNTIDVIGYCRIFCGSFTSR